MAPQILSAATGNSDAGTTAAALLPVLGTILGGGGGGGAPPQRNPSQGSPPGGGGGGGAGLASLILPVVGSLLGGGGGGGNRPAPPRQGVSSPFRPPLPTITTTTTTTTTTEAAQVQPECPGTCIASYLSFTCFGNAEMTEVFSCEKKSTTCCSPKSAVKERKKELERIKFGAIKRIDPANAIDNFQDPLPQIGPVKPTLEHPITNKYICGVKGTYR